MTAEIYSPQNFAFQRPFINHLMDTDNPKILIKLYGTCKYFFAKKNVVVVEDLKVCPNRSLKRIQNVKRCASDAKEMLRMSDSDFGDLNHKIWVTNMLEFAKVPQEIRVKIAKCDATIIFLYGNIAIADFKMIVNKKKLNQLFLVGKIYFPDKSYLFADEILSMIPNARHINITPFRWNKNTLENLSKYKHNVEIHSITLYEIRHPLDAVLMNEFFKNNIYEAFETHFVKEDDCRIFAVETEALVRQWNRNVEHFNFRNSTFTVCIP